MSTSVAIKISLVSIKKDTCFIKTSNKDCDKPGKNSLEVYICVVYRVGQTFRNGSITLEPSIILNRDFGIIMYTIFVV